MLCFRCWHEPGTPILMQTLGAQVTEQYQCLGVVAMVCFRLDVSQVGKRDGQLRVKSKGSAGEVTSGSDRVSFGIWYYCSVVFGSG